MSISAEDRARIAQAIQRAEAHTSGEIVCVLARTSSQATALPVFVAAALALALPWLLVAATDMAVERILLSQLLLFVAAAALLCLPRVRSALVPRAAGRSAAHRAAAQQFLIRGIARKPERTGILIFVSLAERYARIIADEGIAARVPQRDWQGAVDALIAHSRDGRIADGFIAAIEMCGQLLAEAAPQTAAAQDRLPDRLYVL
ncbi:MAG: TPM domain-containing protein [Variibacter sp.]|nr:TPM domain-containing protein [Variibacter sp.]